MVKLLRELAPAKINLFLRITGRRADGYHELDSLFVPVAIYDRLTIEMRPAAAPGVELTCNRSDLGAARDNLAVRAALAFMDCFNINATIAIDLHKEIPAGAGLGGGSSDAAAILRALARLCRVDIGENLRPLALSLGADVPFFLAPRPAHVRGIGELIDPLPDFVPLDVVIVVPAITVSTAEVFKSLRPQDWSGPFAEKNLQQLASGRIDPADLRNDLETVALARWPVIGELKRALEQSGASAAAMTGSGGAVFGIYPSTAAAQIAAQTLRAMHPSARVFQTSVLPVSPRIESIVH